MPRTAFLLMASLVFCGLACTACAASPEITDPAEAMKDPDFGIQGEYVGEGTWSGSDKVKIGAQVIALSGGKFNVVVTKGGLPGDGWSRGDDKVSLRGTRDENTTTLSDSDSLYSGKIVGDAMTIASTDGKTKLELKRTVRHSPTEGAKPIEGALVLFDGTTAENFARGKLLPDGNLLSDAMSKQGFGDYTLHVEFRLSYMPAARGQGRSNSGVYLHNCYEIQVLDSFGLVGKDDDCGGFYKLRNADVNMCYPPLTWQTYDIDFAAARYDPTGQKQKLGRCTVKFNDVTILDDVEIKGSTPGGIAESPDPAGIYLQAHGHQVFFKNIWIVEKK
jgi:hypothetical protein